MTPLEWLFATLVVAVGSAVQGSVGFGLGVVGAPILILIDPRLVPAPILLDALLLTLLVTVREWKHVRIADLSWSVPGRVLGTGLAVVVLKVLPESRLQFTMGLLMLLAVALTLVGPRVRVGRGSLFGAGALAGVMGTITSIGGPPMALLYQHEEGGRLRGTLAAFFSLGVLLSLIGLYVVGRFGWADVRLAALLLPGVLLGFALSAWTAARLDKRQTRAVVLTTSAAAGVMVVLEGLL
ncbi:MAG: sulfite exporter TauE/SafE family protein [Gemmatimonadetes bacterium]|nr:sulfite exporter TauE/SafE family protein [Gemmatimonadota bacterium]